METVYAAEETISTAKETVPAAAALLQQELSHCTYTLK